MKHQTLYLTVFLFAILAFAGNCRKAELSFENNGSNGTGISISGRVLDKNNVPVNQAEVKAGTATTRTDVNGYFQITNVSLPKDAAYVKVDKSGFFQGSRTFIAHEGAVNYVNIRLIPKENTGSFSATGGGIIALPSGGNIAFQPNSVVDAATNNAYTGTVNVSAFFIDPSQDDFITIMPGDLRGITIGGEERGLQSFGMMAVELTSPGGQKLQLASGKPAAINFAIPASLLSTAPAAIPLWYFDETTGLWKEEGSAAKQGNFYFGTVKHFSFWNCDAPFALVNFDAVVKDQNGHPLPNATVIIKKVDNSSMAAALTDELGRVSGKIPANEPLQIKVEDRCKNQLFTQNIGPYSSNVNYGTITVNVQPQSSVVITGTAVSCANTPVTNGFVNISLEGMTYRANINNGSFTISILRCNSNPAQAQIFAEDVAAQQQGAPIILNVTSGNANAGQLNACGTTTDEFVNYTLSGNNHAFTSPADLLDFYHIDSMGMVYNSMMASTVNKDNYLHMDYDGPAATGSYPVKVTVVHGATKYEGQGFNVTITQFGGVGQFITGSFTGTLLVGGITPHTITCNFKVRRT